MAGLRHNRYRLTDQSSDRRLCTHTHDTPHIAPLVWFSALWNHWNSTPLVRVWACRTRRDSLPGRAHGLARPPCDEADACALHGESPRLFLPLAGCALGAAAQPPPGLRPASARPRPGRPTCLASWSARPHPQNRHHPHRQHTPRAPSDGWVPHGARAVGGCPIASKYCIRLASELHQVSLRLSR